MTSPIKGLISPTTGLFPALKEIVGRTEIDDGILRIENNNEIAGDVALIQNRYITGAYENSTGAKGVQALTKLLAMRKGSFTFIPTADGFGTNLQQTLKLDVKKLVSEETSDHRVEQAQPAPSENKVVVPHYASDQIAAEQTKKAPDKSSQDAVNDKKQTSIYVFKNTATADGQYVYADLPENDDLFSLLEHFGLSVEQSVADQKSVADRLALAPPVVAPVAKPTVVKPAALEPPVANSPEPEPVTSEPQPVAITSAAEGAEVGTWAARVLSGQKGETIRPLPLATPPLVPNTGSADESKPDQEESWTERVIAAARKAKANIPEDKVKSLSEEKSTIEKIDVDQSASMRLKFHGKAPTPNLPDRLQQSGANIWSKHRNKINAACIIISMIITSIVLERSILALIYVRKAEDRLLGSNYDLAMKDVSTALSFDPGLQAAHYVKGRAFAKLGQEANALAEFNIVLADNPRDFAALERRASICVTLGDFKQTLDDCNQMIKLRPMACKEYVYANRGIANYMLGNREAAIQDFTTALNMKGKDVALLTRRGATYSWNGQTDKAIKDYDTAIQIDPKNAEAYAGRAQSWMRAKKFKNAFADFDQALKISPISAALLTQRGGSYAVAKQFARADKDFSKALSINPRYAGAYQGRARVSILQHQYGKAEADLKRSAQVKTPDLQFYKQRAELYELMDNRAKARDDYSDALNLQPNDIESLMGRARNLSLLGNQRAALADIDEALKLAPNYAQLYALRGLFGDRYGNTSTTKTDFDRALQLDPNNAEAHLWRGDFLLKQKDFISASNDFEQALKLNPDLVQAKQKRILAQSKLPKTQILAQTTAISNPNKEDLLLIEKGTLPELVEAGYEQMRSNNNDRAVKLLERAVRINPNDAPARRYLAHALIAVGDTDNAIAQLQSVEKLDQNNAEDARALSEALAKVGRTKEAIASYTHYVQMQPEDITSRCTLARLYNDSGETDKAKAICAEGNKIFKNAADLGQIQEVLKEIQNKANRLRNTPAPIQEKPNTEG